MIYSAYGLKAIKQQLNQVQHLIMLSRYKRVFKPKLGNVKVTRITPIIKQTIIRATKSNELTLRVWCTTGDN